MTGAGSTNTNNTRHAVVTMPQQIGIPVNAALTGTNARRKKVDPYSLQIYTNAKMPNLYNNYIDFCIQQETFKYMLIIDGHSAPDRILPALCGGQVLIRAKSFDFVHGQQTWLDTDAKLTAGTHYVSVDCHLKNIQTALTIAQHNSASFLHNAATFAKTHCTKKGIADWWFNALNNIPYLQCPSDNDDIIPTLPYVIKS